jgi:hypothetical protein
VEINWKKFSNRFRSLAPWTKGFPKAMRLVAGIISTLGIGGAIAGYFFANPWLLTMLIPAFLYLNGVVAIALHDSLTPAPVLAIGKLRPDGAGLMFEARVDNNGDGEVTARAYLVELTDSRGNRNPWLGSDMEICWRGLAYGQKQKLSRNKPGWIGVFKVDRTMPDSPVLLLCTPPISGDKPGEFRVVEPARGLLSEHRELRLTLRVDLFNDADERITTESRGFAIIPDKTARMCYRIRPLGWVSNFVEWTRSWLGQFRVHKSQR